VITSRKVETEFFYEQINTGLQLAEGGDFQHKLSTKHLLFYIPSKNVWLRVLNVFINNVSII
jgi:hypothetical protein